MLTFLEIAGSDGIFSKLLLNSVKSLLVFHKVLPNLSRYSKDNAITSSLLIFFKAASDVTYLDKKTSLKFFTASYIPSYWLEKHPFTSAATEISSKQ